MLELKHIAKTYKTAKGVKTEALKDINLRFPQRGMVSVSYTHLDVYKRQGK